MKPRAIRKAIGKQLRFVSRDLRMIAELADMTSGLPRRLYKELLVIQELYRQQQTMYDKRTHSISDRIVSIAQPHVRPIVRGKARANVEFGEKLAISVVNGYAFHEHLSWDSYNEGQTLQDAVDVTAPDLVIIPKRCWPTRSIEPATTCASAKREFA